MIGSESINLDEFRKALSKFSEKGESEKKEELDWRYCVMLSMVNALE